MPEARAAQGHIPAGRIGAGFRGDYWLQLQGWWIATVCGICGFALSAKYRVSEPVALVLVRTAPGLGLGVICTEALL